ncbi:MAG: hypothetical protein PUD09_02355 [Coriobacteriales bacterium]|nr:hypothetical protein [Coriobacteriales bacterium]
MKSGIWHIDLREGFRSLRKWFLVAEALFVCEGGLYLLASVINSKRPPCTFGNEMVVTLAGMQAYLPGMSDPFRFPVSWVILLMLVSYMTLGFPYRDLEGFGQKVLTKSGSRWRWWLSKCVWVTLCVLVYWALLYATLMVFSMATGNGISLKVSDAVPKLVQADLTIRPNTDEFVAFLLVAPCVMTSLCLLQLCLSLFIRPTLSYVATLSILFLSAFYYQCPLLPGNYLMMFRSLGLVRDGYPALQGLVLAIVLGTASVVVGGVAFRRKDILGRTD